MSVTVGIFKRFLETKEDCRTIQIFYNGGYHDFTMADIALGTEHLDKKNIGPLFDGKE